MVFFWITSLVSVPIHVISFAVSGNTLWLAIYSLLYIVWVAILNFFSKRIGKFRRLAIVLYPLLMIVFLGVFAGSMFKKVFRLNVIWKGRTVSAEGKTCE
jgi:4,4'-diaponeurosporenoate glycosyltransferase